jgi:hypothetical protein
MLLASLTYPLKRTKGQFVPHPTTPRPTPHRCPTQRRAPRGLRVWVVPEAATPEPTTPARRALLPSPRAQGPAAQWRPQRV